MILWAATGVARAFQVVLIAQFFVVVLLAPVHMGH